MTDPELAQLARAADWVRGAERICVLTGAGVSAESGVPTFRASDGLWEGHRIEDVASPEGFERDPRLVWQFYNARRANVKTVKPNPGHLALAALEERWGDRFTLVTQNVDGLHRAAGSQQRPGSSRQSVPHALSRLRRGQGSRAGTARRDAALRMRRATASRHRLVRRGAAGRRLGGRRRRRVRVRRVPRRRHVGGRPPGRIAGPDRQAGGRPPRR